MLTFEQLEQIQIADGEQAFYKNLNAEQRRGFEDGNNDALDDIRAETCDDPEVLARLAFHDRRDDLNLTQEQAEVNDYMIGYWYGQVLCG